MLLALLRRIVQRHYARKPELLIQALDSGKFDNEIAKQLEGVELPPLRKFAELQPLDVADWARRKGIPPPPS